CFGTIRNSTALKQKFVSTHNLLSFGTIRNSTALKLEPISNRSILRFGTIRNSTALKPRRKFSFELS
ncbi:TPA: hypothetical protein ACULPQ_000442, partial [Streptococcus agalactiae]